MEGPDLEEAESPEPGKKTAGAFRYEEPGSTFNSTSPQLCDHGGVASPLWPELPKPGQEMIQGLFVDSTGRASVPSPAKGENPLHIAWSKSRQSSEGSTALSTPIREARAKCHPTARWTQALGPSVPVPTLNCDL